MSAVCRLDIFELGLDVSRQVNAMCVPVKL